MYDVCNGTAAAGSAALTLTVGSGAAGTPAGAASGDLVAVCAGSGGGASGQTISSVTDSKGHTYAQQVFDGAVANTGGIWTSLIGSALVAGTDTITVTWSNTNGGKLVVVKGCSGISSATADQASHAHASSSTAPDSGATGVLNQASEVILGFICNAGAGGQPASLSSGGAGVTAHATGLGYACAFNQTVTSTASLHMTGTLPSSAAWCALAATFMQSSSTALSITSLSPPSGTVGTAYGPAGAGYTLTATGGTSPYTWQIVASGTSALTNEAGVIALTTEDGLANLETEG